MKYLQGGNKHCNFSSELCFVGSQSGVWSTRQGHPAFPAGARQSLTPGRALGACLGFIQHPGLAQGRPSPGWLCSHSSRPQLSLVPQLSEISREFTVLIHWAAKVLQKICKKTPNRQKICNSSTSSLAKMFRAGFF